MRRWMSGVMMVGLLLGGLLTDAAPARGQGGGCPGSASYSEGLLTNGGIEEEYYPEGNDLIPTGWTRVNWQGTPNWTSTRLFNVVWNGGAEPEKIECEESSIITGGSNEAWRVGDTFDTVLYQRVTGLTPGAPYSFSGWVLKIWGGTGPGRQQPWRDLHSLGSWIGVDPTGGTDPAASTVIWSDVDWDDDVNAHWANQRMAAVPQGEALTVFVRVRHSQAKDHTVVFVDAMELYDAPRATMQSASGYTPEAQVTLRWEGVLPDSLRARGISGSTFRLFYRVEQEQADGSWATVPGMEELTDASATVGVPEQGLVRFRVVPFTYQRLDLDGGAWPPSTHIGLPTNAVTLTREEPTRSYPFDLYLPLTVRE